MWLKQVMRLEQVFAAKATKNAILFRRVFLSRLTLSVFCLVSVCLRIIIFLYPVRVGTRRLFFVLRFTITLRLLHLPLIRILKRTDQRRIPRVQTLPFNFINSVTKNLQYPSAGQLIAIYSHLSWT